MGIIAKEDVRLDDIYDLIAANGGSLGDSVGSLYSIYANLNMWSKYKPVPSQVLFFSWENWKTSAFKGDNGQCGITIPYYSSVGGFVSAVSSGEDKWYYIPPQGGDMQPMRLDDFRGYCSDAENPIGDIITNGIRDYEKYVTFAIDIAHNSESETNLAISDLSLLNVPLSSFYLGIYAYNEDGDVYMETSADPIGLVNELQVSMLFPNTGKFHYVPFLSSAPQTGSGNNATFIGLNFSPAIVNVIDSDSVRTVTVNALWSADYKSFTIESLYFDNKDANVVTFTDIIVYLYTTNEGDDITTESSLITQVAISGSWTVEAKSVLSVEIGRKVDIGKQDGLDYWIGATSNYNESVEIWSQVQDDPSIMPEMLARIMSLRNL